MTTKDYLETEVKVYLDDMENVAARLVAAGATTQVPRVMECNIRYDNAERTLMPNGIVVRLRRDYRTLLTYKEPAAEEQQDELALARFEVDVEVDDFDRMQIILEKLGYTPAMVYEKQRTTYRLHDAEVVLDEMPYGDFMEIEGKPEDIRWVIERIALEDAPRFKCSYVELFDRVRHHLGMDVRDLTFDNFAGVDVPLSAFDPVDG